MNNHDNRNTDYILADCIERSKLNPVSFNTPNKNSIDKLHIGSLVKLLFLPNKISGVKVNGEFLWVELTDINNPRFAGFLVNQSETIKGLNAKDIIIFETKNISSIFPESDLPEPIKTIQPKTKK